MKKIIKFFLEVFIIILFSTGCAFIFNSFYSKSIPIIAKYPYEIYTDCIEFASETEFISIARAVSKFGRKGIIFVDSRSKKEFKNEHIKDAINITYDVLFPVCDANIDNLKNSELVIVYDNSEEGSKFRPCKELASELKTNGIKNVRYMKEPFSEWKKRGFSVAGGS